MKELFHGRKRTGGNELVMHSAVPGAAAASIKKGGWAQDANGSNLFTVSAISNPVVRHGINFSADGVMQASNTAPTSTAIKFRGFAVTNGALHVDSSGKGFSISNRISISIV